jgi:hypothetical protein
MGQEAYDHKIIELFNKLYDPEKVQIPVTMMQMMAMRTKRILL